MAAHPPTGPAPSNDGSSIFRRGRQPTPAPAPVRPDDLNPDDPAEPLNLDEESVPLDEMPTAPHDLDESASGVLFAEGVESEGVGDSAVTWDAEVRPAATGSGWLDAPPPAKPPSTAKFDDAAALFADLTGSAPDSGTTWEETSVTGRVSDSELLRAYEEAETPESGEIVLPPQQASIFARRDKSAEPDDLLTEDEADGTSELFVPAAHTGGSSIFERTGVGSGTTPKPAGPAADEDDGGVGFNLPQVDDPTGASQASARIDLSSPDFSTEEPAERSRSMADMDLDAAEAAAEDTAVQPVAKTTRRSSKELLVPAAAAAVAAKTRPTADDEDDDLRPAGRTSAGLGKFVGGAAFGLLASGVTFAGLYLFGVIPNGEKDPAPAAVRPAGDPEAVAKLAETEKQLNDTRQAAEAEKATLEAQVLATKKVADDAKQDAADAKKQLPELTAALTKGNDLLSAAKADAETARKETADVKKASETALADVTAAKKEAAEFKKMADAAVTENKTAIAKLEKLGDDFLKEKDRVTKAIEEQGKQVKAAEAAATEAGKKQKAAEASLSGVVTELKSAKLIDDKFDAANLPATIKQLATAATSGDAKKAAEALIAVQKEADTLKANLKAAADETAKAKADADAAKSMVEKVKTDADKAVAAMKADGEKAVAEAKKGVDDKVKAAVEAATKDTAAELAKAKMAVEAVKTTAKAEAEAAARKRIEDATAKATAAEAARTADAKQYEQKLADQANQYAARLAEARAGGVVQVTSVETAAIEKAGKSYADGLTAFTAGRYADAERLFAAATAGHPADARFWYFLGLAQYQQGRDADAAFRKGAELEARQKPNSKAVSEAFERLPLRMRAVVKPYRS